MFYFLNLFDGGEPTIFVFNFNSFKYLYLFSNEKISNFNLSKSESEIIGLSSLKYKYCVFLKDEFYSCNLLLFFFLNHLILFIIFLKKLSLFSFLTIFCIL